VHRSAEEGRGDSKYPKYAYGRVEGGESRMVRFHVSSKAFQLRMLRGTFVVFMLLLLCGLAAAPLTYAQNLSLEKTWGSIGTEYGYDVAVDGSGNIYVTGYSGIFGAGSGDVVLLKYDSSGGLLWQKTWGGTGSDVGRGIAVDGSGNTYVTGYTTSFGAGSGDVVLLKYDSSGALAWQKTWGNTSDDYGYSVAVYGPGSIYVTGHTMSFGVGGDVVLLKFDSSGSLVWQETWGGTGEDVGWGVAVDNSGNVFVIGYTNSFGTSGDFVLLKFDSSGVLQWQETWGGTDIDYGYGVAVDGPGNIYVTGFTASFGAGSADVVLLKYDWSGSLAWQETWGGTSDDYGYGVAVDGSGNIYITGYTISFGAGVWDVVLLKFDSSGGLVWQETWGGTNTDVGRGVAVDGSGDVYFVGQTYNAARTLSGVSGIVTTPSGTVGAPTFSLGTPTYPLGTPEGTVGSPSGSETYAGGWDIFLLRLSQGTNVKTLQGFAGLPSGNVLMVIGDISVNQHGSKPPGVNFQIGRDMTPLGFVSGMLDNAQPTKFDTNTAWIDTTTGRPLASIAPTVIFSVGGPGINAVSYYYENTPTGFFEDRAPITFSMNATHYKWTQLSGNEVLAVLRSSCSDPLANSDVFVVQTLRDGDGRLVALLYGTHYYGTWAAGWWFKYTVYPNIAAYTDSYYIVRWTDAASGADADYTPSAGDTYEILT